MSIKTKFLQWVKTPLFWAVAGALVYAAVMMYITIHLLHDSYHSSAFDLGVFTEELKYSLQGKILYSPAIGGSQFAPHFSPVLLLLVPIYWLFPHAQMLLVVQALLLAFSGYIIYVIAREYNYSHKTSLIIEGLFFINPLVWGVALFDFHEVVFAIPALLVIFLGLKRKNWIFFGLGLLFALASKEDAVVALGVFGAVLIVFDYWQHKKVEKTSIIIFLSAILTYGLGVAVSHLASGGEHTRLLSYFTSRYAYVGLPLSQAIPMAVKTIFSMSSLFLIGAYLAPLAFLPLLSPKLVTPALFVLLTGILSTNTNQHDMLMQYPAAAIPFLFIAFMEVLPKIQANHEIQSYVKKSNNRAVAYSVIFLVIISFGIITEGRITIASFPDKHDQAINQIIALIPDKATVTTSNMIFPHLCTRTEIYMDGIEGELMAPSGGITNAVWGYPEKDTEYVVVDILSNRTYSVYVLEHSTKYSLIKGVDGVLLFKRNL
jgi:uncharacterized membrane protein